MVQGTLMRGTIHTVARGDYRLFLGAIAAHAARVGRQGDQGSGEPGAVGGAGAHPSRAGRGPMKRPALIALLRDEHPAVRYSIDTDLAILRVPPSGTWERRRADLCALADDVIGPGEEVPEAVALPALVERYLAAFGPASVNDVATFLGMNVSPVRALADDPGAPTVPGRGRDRALRRRGRAAAGSGDRSAGPIPADLGRGPPRARQADAGAAGGVSAARVPRQDAALVPDLPRRRPGGRNLAARGRGDSALAVRRAAVPVTAWRSRRRRTSSPHSTPEATDVRWPP